VYSLDATEKLKICFVDDEKDNVAMSSDEEFLYAVDLVRPVRLVITLASCIPASAGEANSCPVEPHSVESHSVEHPFQCRRGRGRGHFRGDKQWNEERMKKNMEDSSLTKEEKIQHKTAKISEKIKLIEALLLTELPAPRERSLSWKLERLRFKLARLQSWSAGTETEAPVTAVNTEAVPSRRGCRGRGGRGRGGRGKWSENTEDTGCRQIDYQVWEDIRTCRQNLRSANQSGNQEEIDRCSKALEAAKTQKWEAKQKAKAAHREGKPEPRLFEQKSHKRECMKNLRDAKASGDAEKIFAAEQALIDAKEALQKAKVANNC